MLYLQIQHHKIYFDLTLHNYLQLTIINLQV